MISIIVVTALELFIKFKMKEHIVKSGAFWWEIEEKLSPTNDGYKLPLEIEFVIVGGGYTGLSAAITIARQGRSVLVLDSGMPGFGASTRNGGICSGQIRLSHGKLSQKFGVIYADAVYAEGIQARLDLAKFCAEEQIDCDLQLTGRFTGAMSRRDYDNQSREVERLNKIPGHKASMVLKADQHNEINTDLFYGGMLREEIGGFHPGKFFAGLLKSAQQSGAIIRSNTTVHEVLDLSPGRKSVITNKGKVNASKVIISTNAYTGRQQSVGKFLRKRLVTAQSCIIVTEQLGIEKIKNLMPKLRMYGNTAKLYSYFRPTPNLDRILLGSRSFDKIEPTNRSIKYLKRKLVQIFPELKDCVIEYCWLGNVGFTRTQVPVIFEHNGMYYAAGYAGSGTVWARWLGKKVAETAMGTENQPSIFYGDPPPNIPLYNGNPWFLPAIQSYFAFTDWLKKAY